MVFGNSGENSGTGVAQEIQLLEKIIYSESTYLMLKVGDVVAGIRTPKDIDTLKQQMPDVHQEFVDVTKQLENITKICKT